MQIFPSVVKKDDDSIGDSAIHRLGPRVKLISVILLLAAVSAAETWKEISMAATVVFLLFFYSRIPFFLNMVKRLRPFFWFFLFTAVMHLFFTPGKPLPFFPLGHITITYDGVMRSSIIISRLSLVIIVASLLTLTTSPVSIAKGIEGLLSPFKKIIPGVETFSSMTFLTIQFIPLLIKKAEVEIQEKRKNQDINRRGFIGRIKAISLLVDSYVKSVLLDAEKMIETDYSFPKSNAL